MVSTLWKPGVYSQRVTAYRAKSWTGQLDATTWSDALGLSPVALVA